MSDRYIAVLMACHNRAKTTVRCLQLLMEATSTWQNGNDAGSTRKLRVFLVDDGSTDGTEEEVGRLFDDSMVQIIKGNGELFWAKGMELAWRTAIDVESSGSRFTHFLWLNDDAMLNPNAVESLFSKDDGRSLVVGDLCDATGRSVYGLNVNGWVNGNCVLVPRRIYECIGMICGDYCHAWADSDYALRVMRAGFDIVSTGIVGVAEWHPLRPPLAGKSLGERWLLLFDPKGWNLHDLWLYRRRNWGWARAVLSCVHFTVKVLIGR